MVDFAQSNGDYQLDSHWFLTQWLCYSMCSIGTGSFSLSNLSTTWSFWKRRKIHEKRRTNSPSNNSLYLYLFPIFALFNLASIYILDISFKTFQFIKPLNKLSNCCSMNWKFNTYRYWYLVGSLFWEYTFVILFHFFFHSNFYFKFIEIIQKWYIY